MSDFGCHVDKGLRSKINRDLGDLDWERLKMIRDLGTLDQDQPNICPIHNVTKFRSPYIGPYQDSGRLNLLSLWAISVVGPCPTQPILVAMWTRVCNQKSIVTQATWIGSNSISLQSLKNIGHTFCGDVTFGLYKEVTNPTFPTFPCGVQSLVIITTTALHL